MRKRRGFVMIAATVALPTLMAFLGLATDVGYLQWQKVHARMAADAAAQGAGLQLLDGNGASAAVSEGQYDASLNGFTQGVSSTTVTVNSPPLSGPHTGDSSAAEVIIQRSVPTFFMNIVGSPSANVTARAVTVLGNNGGAGCVFAMDATVSQAFNFQGSNTAYFGCGLEVASSSSSALYMGGTAVLEMKNDASVGVVGGADLTGQTKIVNYNTGQSQAVLQIGAPADPLSYVDAPSPSGTLHSSATNYDMNSIPSGNTIQPGIYCGGLTIGNTNGATFTMASGVYYMAGGGLTINSLATVTGTGVTIYNTSSANAGVSGCSGKSFAPITISGQANVTLSAPTNDTGPGIEGVLIFQDRRITSTSSTQINGGSTTQLSGAIYLLHSPLLYSGTNSSGGYQILVADTITINGNSNVTINSDYSSLQDGSPIHNAAILEE